MGELRAQLYIALDQGYLGAPTFEELSQLASCAGRLIGGLMGYLHRSGIRGPKFR